MVTDYVDTPIYIHVTALGELKEDREMLGREEGRGEIDGRQRGREGGREGGRK